MDCLDWEEDQQDDESRLSQQVQEGEGGRIVRQENADKDTTCHDLESPSGL